MHALIDGDIFAYEFGNAKETNSEQPLPWPFIVSRLDARIENILSAVGAESSQIYLSGKSNFRLGIATIRPYKGNRPQDKPYWWGKIRDFLVHHRDAVVVDGIEADDILGIEQFKDLPGDKIAEATVICSRDKDLDMIPGWHYSWSAGNQKEKPIWWQDELSGLRAFYSQLLTGDPVDNIPGLYGVGNSSKLVSNLSSLSTELEMYSYVRGEYEKRFGTYWKQFLNENAQLLWILRTHDTDEVLKRLEELEKQLEEIYNEEFS